MEKNKLWNSPEAPVWELVSFKLFINYMESKISSEVVNDLVIII